MRMPNNLGELAYTAYRTKAANAGYPEPMLEWDDLPGPIRAGFNAAVTVVIDVFSNVLKEEIRTQAHEAEREIKTRNQGPKQKRTKKR